jgi:hypothetical protein
MFQSEMSQNENMLAPGAEARDTDLRAHTGRGKADVEQTS